MHKYCILLFIRLGVATRLALLFSIVLPRPFKGEGWGEGDI